MSMADMVCLDCIQKLHVECTSSAGSVWLILYWKSLLLLDMANIVFFYVKDCGVSKAEYLIHSMCIREFCGAHSWQNS